MKRFLAVNLLFMLIVYWVSAFDIEVDPVDIAVSPVVTWGHPTARDLAGLWLFDEGSGKTVRDMVGGNDGTLYGFTHPADVNRGWAIGQIGTELRTDEPAYIIFTEEDKGGLLDFAGQYAITVVVKWLPHAVTYANKVLVSKWSGAPVNKQQFILWYSGSTQKITFRLRTGGTGMTGVLQEVTSTVNINNATAKWYVLAGVYDGEFVHLYIDGVLNNSAAASGAINSVADAELRMCTHQTGSLPGLDGAMAYLAIYRKALSAPEVRELSDDVYAMMYKPNIVEIIPAIGVASVGQVIMIGD